MKKRISVCIVFIILIFIIISGRFKAKAVFTSKSNESIKIL